MDLKKLAPWNWFKKEENDSHAVPVQHAHQSAYSKNQEKPIFQLHKEINRLFDEVFSTHNHIPSMRHNILLNSITKGMLKPKLDISTDNSLYTISLEIPGVDLRDIKLEVSDSTLIVKGEKRQTEEEKRKNFYRMERSYGSFQRVLDLPDDADQENIDAKFKNGVLTITIPQKATKISRIKQIEIS